MTETLRDRRLRYARAILQSRPTSTALVGENTSLEGLRVLVLGSFPADTLCALMHTECRKAEARQPDGHTEARSADLVLAPHVTLITISRVIAQAARSLDGRGRIVIAVPPFEHDFVNLTIRALLQAGFEMPTLQSEAGDTRIHAQLGHLATSN